MYCLVQATDIDKLPLQRTVDEFFRRNRKRTVRVLEAGCGSATHLRMGENAWVVGIDISKEQLRRNVLLQEEIIGDIQYCELSRCTYDMIVCWNVLEHLSRPEKALANMARAVREGGIIILRYPNVFSAQGLVAKFTPHFFHVWAYRHILGRPWAGTEGRGPFRTFLRFSIRPAALRRFAMKNDLAVQTCSTFDRGKPPRVKETRPFLHVVLRCVSACVSIVTLGFVSSHRSGCLVVLHKQSRMMRSNG